MKKKKEIIMAGATTITKPLANLRERTQKMEHDLVL